MLKYTNKPKEDQEKWGLNKKVKKLKRSWPYLKESSQILEPSAKSRKISPKVRKNRTNLKTKKRKEVDQKSNEKAEKISSKKIVQKKLRPLKSRFIYATNVL